MLFANIKFLSKLNNTLTKWWCCAKPKKRVLVSAVLGPQQHALAWMLIYDDHTVNYAEVTNLLTQHTDFNYIIFCYNHLLTD